MDRRLTFPTFSKAPKEYNPDYFQDMTRLLNTLVTALLTPGVGRQTTMVFTDLPTDDYNLEPGGLFQIDGVLRVSILPTAYVRGQSATGRVGTISVTTA